MSMAVFLLVGLFVLLGLGTPVAFALGLTGLAMILVYDVTSLTQLAQSQFSALDSFVLLAIPFFILAGNVMVQARLAPHLFGFVRALTRPIRGGDAVGAALSAALFGAMAGSSAASAAALGRVVIPELDRGNYPRRFSAGLLAAGGTLGIMIPPSIVFVIYGAMARVSVTDMFKAGIVPGLLVTALLIAVTLVLSRRNAWGERAPFSLGHAARVALTALPALLMPVIVLGGIYGGIFTPTEAAAIAAIYGLAIGLLLYRSLGPATLAIVFTRSARMTATILVIVAQAIFIGFLATLAGIPQGIVEAVNGLALEPWMFLLIVNLVLLVLGCFFDGVTLLTVITPLLLPAVRALGIDPVHFGIVLTLNIEIAAITPPIGMNLFVIAGVSRTRTEEVIRGVVPFMAVMLLALIVVTYVPWFSLALIR
ncbi:TRAP transporter large permease [Aquibium sp. A9E412]|uniref:TRAP transporter large permease n=1 Tax=Aquibium sp. A9E412 TaxID=2976767 RepID=UPI0025AF74A5|nr:TRAP transporter large permease [Aquibium sp. A9E412]MDN2567831.1 TRAP transporter large permease [Aquibium sp. A9E412]